MAAQPDFKLESLRGGFNDAPASQLEQDQCTTANNVEFFWSMLGERRYGCEALNITGSGISSYDLIAHLSEWFPANVTTTSEIWTVAATPDTSAVFRYRTTGLVWTTPSVVDAINPDAPEIYEITTQCGPSSLAPMGKLFIFYPNDDGYDGSHVWDPNGSTPEVRRTGLPEADPPTVANQGSGAVPATKRYYRIRWAQENGSGSELTLLGEPSTSVSITPSGAGLSVRVTRPSVPADEPITHWVVEASFDDANFYVLGNPVAIATTTYDDTTTNPISFADEGPLSDAIGAYLRPPNAKYGGVDGDRLVMAGHWDDVSLMSSVWWTPPFTDPGIGNDERVPIVTTGGLAISSTLSLDNFSGGGITGMSTAIAGSWYVFKFNRIYKLVRTNRVSMAYQPMTMSTSRGAVKGSVFSGADEHGGPAIFFVDPLQGPSMINSAGLRTIVGLRKTWNRVNLSAANVVARGVYYPYKRQAHWWLAMENADSPNFKAVLQITELRQIDDTHVGRGWSTATGRITEAFCVALITEDILINGVTTLRARPFIGLDDPDWIQRCDSEVVTEDAGTAYRAVIVTAPLILAGLLTEFGAMRTAILASANPDTLVEISLIRNFGTEETDPTSVDLSPAGTEPYVIKQQDSLRLSESVTMQIQFADPE